MIRSSTRGPRTVHGLSAPARPLAGRGRANGESSERNEAADASGLGGSTTRRHACPPRACTSHARGIRGAAQFWQTGRSGAGGGGGSRGGRKPTPKDSSKAKDVSSASIAPAVATTMSDASSNAPTPPPSATTTTTLGSVPQRRRHREGQVEHAYGIQRVSTASATSVHPCNHLTAIPISLPSAFRRTQPSRGCSSGRSSADRPCSWRTTSSRPSAARRSPSRGS